MKYGNKEHALIIQALALMVPEQEEIESVDEYVARKAMARLVLHEVMNRPKRGNDDEV